MEQLSREEIEQIVEVGDWNRLKGRIEGDCLDCKEQIYDLNSDTKKIELAKDISALANASGGYILIGVKTKTSTTHFSDEITGLKPFKQTFLNTDQYSKVINEWLYPAIDGLKVEWRAESKGRDTGFGVITVPEQTGQKKPFLVSRTLTSTGKRSDVIFGYVQRRQERNEPLKLGELHQVFRDGLNFQNELLSRLDAIEARLPREETFFTGRSPDFGGLEKSLQGKVEGKRPDWETEIRSRLEQLVLDAGYTDRRYFALVAYPDTPTPIPDFFRHGDNTILSILERPPHSEGRPSGFGPIGGRATINKGESWRSIGSREALELYREGTLFLVVPMDEDFLCWGDKQGADKKQKINTLALIECVYLFCVLYEEILEKCPGQPRKLFFQFHIDNDNRPPVYLVPFPISAIHWEHPMNEDIHKAPAQRVVKALDLEGKSFEARIAAYKIVEEIFLWFGVPPTDIPYSNKNRESGESFIDEPLFRNLGGQGGSILTKQI